jgi:hypothetical protein
MMDEQFKEMLEVEDYEKYGTLYQLTIPADKNKSLDSILEFHTTDHFVVLGKYEIWATITSIICSTEDIKLAFKFLTN